MVLAKTAYSREHETKFIDLYHAWLLSNREYRRTTMGLSTLYIMGNQKQMEDNLKQVDQLDPGWHRVQ